MSSFQDAAGREWTIRLTARRLTQLREMLGFSIAIVATPEGLAEWRGPEVARNPEKFAEVLNLLLADQFVERSVTREEFEDAFDADVYRAAGKAFEDAILGFSLVPDALRAVLAGAGDETATRPPSSTSNSGATNSPGPPA